MRPLCAGDGNEQRTAAVKRTRDRMWIIRMSAPKVRTSLRHPGWRCSPTESRPRGIKTGAELKLSRSLKADPHSALDYVLHEQPGLAGLGGELGGISEVEALDHERAAGEAS